jgi:hypothetical protein
MIVGALLVETLVIHLPALLPAIPGHPGLIEYIDAMVIGILLMVMLWFRPQGMVPERVRRSRFFLPEFASSGSGSGASTGVLTPSGPHVTADEVPGAEPSVEATDEELK